MSPLPTLFLSHGVPDLPIQSGSTPTFLRQLAQTLPRPSAILAISAHWSTAQPTLSTASHPQTLYDFGGFPQVSQLHYPAPGAPDVAAKAIARLTEAGFSATADSSRGLDHGVWTPLLLAYPDACIPVTQLSVQPHHAAEYHLQLGAALAPLRREGVLIVGSGAATHNLRAFRPEYDASPPPWAVAFDRWLAAAIARDDRAALLTYQQAPYAAQNHPTAEHLLPLFVALGAGGPGRQIHQGFTYGAFSMAAYRFS